jgi:hypothetical protein
MQSVSFPTRPSAPAPAVQPKESVTLYEVLFFFVLFLFLAVVCVWPVLTWRIHHVSTWVPDAVHSYVIHQHGATFYMTPALGKFYVSLPWLWCALLVATVLTGFLTSKRPGTRK